jgi:hypothetical protein
MILNAAIPHPRSCTLIDQKGRGMRPSDSGASRGPRRLGQIGIDTLPKSLEINHRKRALRSSRFRPNLNQLGQARTLHRR